MRKLLLGVPLLTVVFVATSALATPPRGIVTDAVDVVTATGDERVDARDHGIRFKAGRHAPFDTLIQTGTFHPGWSSGWHGHAGFAIVAIKSGKLVRYTERCKRKTFSAGQSFVETGREHALLLRNESSQPAVAYFSWVVPSGDLPERRIDLPNPGCRVD